jgi:LmbE family N-acetylglucosaminyl deacetylase
MLDYPSADVKQADSPGLVSELTALFAASRPKVVYTHNPADKHDTHVAVALRTIQALRALPEDAMPRYLYGCEVWRDLDWLINEDKVALQVDGHENLAAALLGVFDSQIAGGKRYDLATMGRRRANATYYAAHDIDAATGLIFAMDLTPLIVDPGLAINDFIMNHIQRFARDVRARIDKLQ